MLDGFYICLCRVPLTFQAVARAIVTSPAHTNASQVMIDRKTKAMINSGYCLSRADLAIFFDIVE